MSGKIYVSEMHNVHKALEDVDYPCTKAEIIRKDGAKVVRLDWNLTKTIGELVKPIKLEKFCCAAAFYNALVASMNEGKM